LRRNLLQFVRLEPWLTAAASAAAKFGIAAGFCNMKYAAVRFLLQNSIAAQAESVFTAGGFIFISFRRNQAIIFR